MARRKEEQTELGFSGPVVESVEKYQFDYEPIQGYPELRWQGKRPFRSTQYYPAQLKEQHGEPVDGWLNRIYWGDNLQVMSHLLKEFRGKIKLIYIDPPFDSRADYKMIIKLRGKEVNNDYTAFEEKQYTDIWSNDEYLQFMYERLILMRELLTNDGSIYLHCDWHKGYFLRCLLDEVMGPTAFKNEIVWYYYNKMQGNINRFASNHDIIYWYSKTYTPPFNKIYEKREKPIQQIKRVWDKEKQSLVNAKDENGNIIYITSTHRTVDDVWKLSMLQPADKSEPVGYPTQKPESLLERIIKASSNPGDLIFDCFMGSGTTQAVSLKMGRRFIGADINLGAIQVATARLLKAVAEVEPICSDQSQLELDLVAESCGDYQADITKVTKYYTGFSLYNVNYYDVFRNPMEARDLLLQALEIQPLPAGSLFDGEKDGRFVKIMPINRISTRADLSELVTGFDYKEFEKRRNDNPTQPVENIILVCMGHEPDLAAQLEMDTGFKLDVEVVDILRDKANLEFKRDSQAKVGRKDNMLIIEKFYPMNLLQKLSLMQEEVSDWRELVECIMIDWDYDGQILKPNLVDIPGKNELVKGKYTIPDEVGIIRVKITDLLSESLEVEV